jgi:hypothetical protein
MVYIGERDLAVSFGGVRAPRPTALILSRGCRAASPLAAVAVCGGGKIFVYNVAKVVKVRTGEQDYAALQDVE